jgi:hypothetical protein
MVTLTREESLAAADMLRFALEHLTEDFTTYLEVYDKEIKLYRKLIKTHL